MNVITFELFEFSLQTWTLFWSSTSYMSQMNSELELLILIIKIKLAFKLEQFLKKNWTVFHYTFKLEVWIDHLLDFSGEGGGQIGAGGADTCFLRMQKKPSLVDLAILQSFLL